MRHILRQGILAAFLCLIGFMAAAQPPAPPPPCPPNVLQC
jgi:hypothetical protein